MENAAADGKQAASPEFRERAFKFAERKAVVVRRRSTVAAKEHVLEAKTFKTPTFCAHCSELLWGLYRQGLACTKCGRAVHRRCANALSVACAVPRLNHKEDIHPVPHQFQYETFMRPRTCKQCSTMVYGRGLRCARDTCQTIVHVACEKKMPPLCGVQATSQQQVESIIRLAQAKTDTVPPIAISGVTGGQAIDGRNGQPIVVDTFGNLDSQLSQLSLSQKAQRTSQRRASAPVPVMTDYRNIGIYGNPVRENGNQPSALLNTPPSRPPPVPPKSLGPNSVAPSTPEQLFSDRPRSTTNPPHPNFQTPPSPTSTLSTPALSVPARPPPPVPVDLSRRNTVSGIPSRPPPPIPVEIPEDPPEPLYMNMNMNMNPPKQSNLQSLQQNGPVGSQRPQVSLADFYFDKVLGSGAFGKVMLAQYKPTGRAVAVKVLRKDVMLEAMGSEDIASELREKIVLESAHGCPYLCELFATFQTRERLFLVMGYYSGGRLLDLVLNLPQFPEAIAKFYTAELVLALGFLHERHIVYRDLKLENIMIDGQGHIKLIDFGLCKTDIDLLGSTHTFCGTLDYMAPEILAGHPYAYSVDWWALGVLLYELVCKQPPWESDEENEKMQEIQYAEILYPRTLAADTKAFLKALLTRDPLRRLGGWGGAYEVKQHAFYRGINWPLLERGALKPPFTPTQEICIDAHPNTALSPVPSTEEVFFENFDYTNPDFFQ